MMIVLQMLAEGRTRQEITKHLKDNFGVSQSTINLDFINALSELKTQQEPFISDLKSIIADRYELLWQRAMERGDFKTAATVLKQQTALFGLDAPQKLDVGDSEFTITFN